MKPAEYHSILIALDQALAVFARSEDEPTDDDRELLKRLEILRSQVLKAESGHPFPLRARPETAADVALRVAFGGSPHGPSADPAEPKAANIRVLIADDHDTVRSIVRTLLAVEGGFDVVGEAVNGREAVELARLYRPDVVIMDLTMPLLDGLSATREVLQLLPDTKIIVFSANQDPSASRVAFAAGAVGYLTKPTSRKLLIAALRGAVQAKPAAVPG